MMNLVQMSVMGTSGPSRMCFPVGAFSSFMGGSATSSFSYVELPCVIDGVSYPYARAGIVFSSSGFDEDTSCSPVMYASDGSVAPDIDGYHCYGLDLTSVIPASLLSGVSLDGVMASGEVTPGGLMPSASECSPSLSYYVYVRADDPKDFRSAYPGGCPTDYSPNESSVTDQIYGSRAATQVEGAGSMVVNSSVVLGNGVYVGVPGQSYLFRIVEGLVPTPLPMIGGADEPGMPVLQLPVSIIRHGASDVRVNRILNATWASDEITSVPARA